MWDVLKYYSFIRMPPGNPVLQGGEQSTSVAINDSILLFPVHPPSE